MNSTVVVTEIKKIIIYHCYGGSHSSAVAAALHTGLLKPEQAVSDNYLLSLPYFDTQKADDHGVLQFVGTDENGNLVFSVGLETVGPSVITALKATLAIFGQHYQHMHFIDTLPAVNLWMKLGGVCSRALGLKQIGRPLVTYGVKKAIYDLQKIVDVVKEERI